MLRAILVVIGVGIIGWGGLYRLGLREAGYDPPVSMTVAQVLAGVPCSLERNQPISDDKHIRLDNVEVDTTRTLAIPDDDVWTYAPVKGTQDKLYLEIWRSEAPPSGSTTVIGYQRHRASESLPLQLEAQAKRGELFLVSYENWNYYHYQESEAVPYFIIGGGVLALAALLQFLAFLGGAWDKRKLAQAREAATIAPGPCTLCSATAARLPVYIEAQKRRVAGYRLARVTSISMWADCCPECYTKLGSLWKVTVAGQMALVPLVFALPLGVILVVMHGLGFLVLGCVVGLFFLLQFWINRRYDRILGPLHAQLKQKLEVSLWNPLADKITYGLRFVDAETGSEQRTE